MHTDAFSSENNLWKTCFPAGTTIWSVKRRIQFVQEERSFPVENKCIKLSAAEPFEKFLDVYQA